jgi:hypothetical protein
MNFSFRKSEAKRPEHIPGASPEMVRVIYLSLARSSRAFLLSSFGPAFPPGFFSLFRGQSIHEFVGLFFRGVFGHSIMLLELANQLLALAVNDVEVVIG